MILTIYIYNTILYNTIIPYHIPLIIALKVNGLFDQQTQPALETPRPSCAEGLEIPHGGDAWLPGTYDLRSAW